MRGAMKNKSPMSKISSAITEIQRIEDLQKRDQWLNRIHPLVKLACTCFYIVCLVSFHPYDIQGVLSMGLYPLILFMAGDLSITDCLRRVRIVLPLVCLIGLFNPIFDRTPMLLFGFVVRAGFVSMLTLILKGVFAVLSSYILIASTSIENLCYAMSLLHLPGIMTVKINDRPETLRQLGAAHLNGTADHLRIGDGHNARHNGNRNPLIPYAIKEIAKQVVVEKHLAGQKIAAGIRLLF